MNRYTIKYTNEFKKGVKKLIRQGKDIDKLLLVVNKLSLKEELDYKYKDHALYNDKKFKNCRDCHIEPDWILIYKYLNNELILVLVATESHFRSFR